MVADLPPLKPWRSASECRTVPLCNELSVSADLLLSQKQMTPVASRGSGMSGQEFRKRLEALGFGQTAFARRLVELGDPRSVEQVLRLISNYASGATKVPGFVIVILNLMDASDAARGEVSGRRRKKVQTVP
jgi:hypothetical protein